MGFELRPTAELADGALPDVPFDPMTLTGCAQPAPFLHFIDVIQPGNPSTQFARYCYAGLAGPLQASVMYASSGDVFTVDSVAIEAQVAPLYFGGSSCTACFVRLEANGLVADGPVTDYFGD